MNIDRRRLLQSVLFVPPFAAGLGRLAAADAGRPLLLLCDGIDPAADARLLAAFFSPFETRKLKLGLVIGDKAGGADMVSGVEALPLSTLCGPADAGRIEWIVEHPPVIEELTYFQMRRATEAQRKFAAFRAACGDAEGPWRSSLTVSCPQPASAVPALDGVRAAGFRNVVFRPEADRPVELWATDNGVLQLLGGLRAELSKIDRVIAAIAQPGDPQQPLLIHLSLQRLTDFAADTLGAMADALADMIATSAYGGTIVPMLPSELHLANGGAMRCVGLHVEVASAESARPLLDSLASAHIAFSASRAGGASTATAECPVLGDPPAATAWQQLQSSTALELAASPKIAAPDACVAITSGASPALFRRVAETGTPLVVTLSATSQDSTGLDDDGLLHVLPDFAFADRDTPLAPQAAAAALGGERLRDAVILVRAGAAESPLMAEPLYDALVGLANGAGNRIVGLQDLARSVMPVDPIFDLLRRSRAQDFTDAPVSADLDGAERTRLLQDADLAWRYFARLTDNSTGIAHATAQAAPGAPVTDPLVTMWDIGSQILATIAALTIEVIKPIEFEGRIDRLVKSLPAADLSGLILPQAIVSADRAPTGERRFNASDTGRLLVALKALRQLGFDTEVAAMVARWDLAKVIGNRRLHDLDSGHLREYAKSNYVDYAVRGFRLWGFETDSPYDLDTAETGTDRQMRLLSRAAELGPIQTEPHLLEAIELGHSETSALVAEMLFAAQRAAYQATGRLFCVSELPLDREPWFSYQGFKLDAKTDPWTVQSLDQESNFTTDDFREGVAAVSTKAAYAWAATRPHPYSQALLSYVRSKAVVPGLGFSSGIYMASGEQMAGYTDSNTNGVILQAIAYILTGRKPLLKAE